MKRLTKIHSWAHCSDSVKTLKAPAVGLGKTAPLSYDKAKANALSKIAGSPYYGFVFSEDSEYIGLDIDVDTNGNKKNSTIEIPGEVLFFLKANPTHVHYSPSGQGIHILYRLDPEAKQYLIDRNVNQMAVSIKNKDMFNGDIRFRKSFLVFTEKEHELSVPDIATITLDKLSEIVPSVTTKKEVQAPPTSLSSQLPLAAALESLARVPTIKQLRDVLDSIPNSFDSSAERACRNLPFSKPASNYDYWVLIGCACAHHAILLEMCGRLADADEVPKVFNDWSKEDKLNYTGETDVFSKFEALRNTTRQKLSTGEYTTTLGTLYTIARGCVIDFPDMIATKTGNTRPDPVSTRNLERLIEHEELELMFDPMAGGICFKGPEQLVTKWFCPSKDYNAIRPEGYSQAASYSDMTTRFKHFMQDRYKYSVTTQNARDAIDHLSQNMRRENAFKAWIQMKPWDGISRFKAVCNSIRIPADEYYEEVYENYIKRSLLSMIGIHFWPEDAPKIPAMLVLTGPEYTFKSSWAEWLIPKYMGNYTATADIETVLAAGKDWQMFLSTKAVVVINECEPMFSPKYEQKVKASVDSETVTYRDVYAKQVLTRPRTALIIGTTNKANLFTGSTGTRKIWQIPVAECDSMLIKNMDLQQLYAEVYTELCEFKTQNPRKLIQEAWAQDEEDRAVTNRLNAKRKGHDIGVLGMLIELFGHYHDRVVDFRSFVGRRGIALNTGTPGGDNSEANAWTATSMSKLIRMEYPDERVDRVQVRYALEEYAAAYTGTTHKPKQPFVNYVTGSMSEAFVTRGFLRHTRGGGGLGFYLMPTPLYRPDEDQLIIEELE